MSGGLKAPRNGCKSPVADATPAATVASDEDLRPMLEELVKAWADRRFPAYHCANDLQYVLNQGRVPPGVQRDGSGR